MRKQPLSDRKAALAKLLRKAKPGIRYSEHLTGDGTAIFEHACKLGLEGIVSKRLNASYRSGKVKTRPKPQEPEVGGHAARAGRRRSSLSLRLPKLIPTAVPLLAELPLDKLPRAPRAKSFS